MFDGVLDGRVFHASDTVTFPPEGQGLKNAFSTAGSFHFCGKYTSDMYADHCHTIFCLPLFEN
jgi:hypothetical protein